MYKPIHLKYGQQKEDPGKLVCEGYTPGSRSDPWWDWARNILSKKHSPEFINGQSMAMSSVFALFYQLMRAVLPSEVLREYDVWLHENAFPRQGYYACNISRSWRSCSDFACILYGTG